MGSRSFQCKSLLSEAYPAHLPSSSPWKSFFHQSTSIRVKAPAPRPCSEVPLLLIRYLPLPRILLYSHSWNLPPLSHAHNGTGEKNEKGKEGMAVPLTWDLILQPPFSFVVWSLVVVSGCLSPRLPSFATVSKCPNRHVTLMEMFRKCQDILVVIAWVPRNGISVRLAHFSFHGENTVSTLGRFVLIIWLFVVLILQSSYTTSLTSILTVQQLSSPIKGIDSVIASNEPIGFQVGSFAENYLVEKLDIPRSRLDSPEDYADALLRGPKEDWGGGGGCR